MKKIIVVNLGSTSTKVAYFEDDTCIRKETINHEAEKIRSFGNVWEQETYRTELILNFMREVGVKPEELSAFVTRGGHTIPIPGGVYRINDEYAAQSASMKYGNHPSDLGVKIAYHMAEKYGMEALTVDPPCTDEFEPLARYSGLKEIIRVSRFHALNQKGAARAYAASIGRKYEDLNLIVIHMGGGTSVAPHHHGRMIDGPYGLEGDGCFTTNRSNGLPVGDLIEMCYSGQYTREEMHRKVNGLGGLMSYIGETDCIKIEEEIRKGNQVYEEALEAMIYQTAKDVGAMASVLKGQVDAVIFTGGIAYSDYVSEHLKNYVSYLGPFVREPGEYEMHSLGTNAYKALIGEEEIKEI